MKKNYKIALVTYDFTNGGTERVVSNSSFVFSKMGCEVYLYILNENIDFPFRGRLRQFPRNRKKGIKKIQNYLHLAKDLQKEKFDFIIDHRWRMNMIMEWVWTKLIYRNQKVFYYIHHSDWWDYMSKSERVNQFLYKGEFICVSKSLEKILNKTFSNLQFRTIYNSVHITESNRSSEISEEEYIICVARMSEDNVKQIDVLLECYSRSVLPSKGIRLKILGDGVRRDEMQSLANQLGVKDCVDFLGFIAEPYPYFRSAKFSVLTSKNEGLPTALIESLALGVPVISFDCPTGPAEIIQHKMNGLLVKDQDKEEMIRAMNLMIENEEQYNLLRDNAKKSIEKFSAESFIKEWEQLFKEYNQ